MHTLGGIRKHLKSIVHIAEERLGSEVSRGGDSGALWLEQGTRKAVALHFAGANSPEFALAFSMAEVLNAFNVSL